MLVGGITCPSEKYELVSSSVGMIFHSQLVLKIHKTCTKPPSSMGYFIGYAGILLGYYEINGMARMRCNEDI